MVNVGIIGAGRIGQVHARSILTGVPDARILSIADPYMSESVAAWAREAGIEGVYKDHRKIMEDPRVEAVLICSSTDTHAQLSLEAIAAGKHVFCEKPIDQKLDRIGEVKAALAASPKSLKYQVGFNRRFDHNFRALKDAVDAGKIGEVQFIRVSSRDPEPPPAGYVKGSGGIFLDMMIHDLDMLRYLSGSEIEEVYATGAVLIDPAIGAAGDVDTATVSARMKNGALALIDNSRKAVYGYDQRAEVFGSKGCVACGNDTASSAVLSTAEGVVSEKPLWFFLQRYMGSYQAEVRLFIESVVKDTPVAVGVADGLLSIKLGLACKKSMEEHRPVRIDEINP
ncbi:MAG: Inositol 2-dehydrogenase [Firmicutes bacterium ADurb.Bin248]|nr:MAG: Inositol 2-dehydrogenase [Firmicutes bacterium ADurb.Bin248]HOG01193.1 inositol 2-dehydrogenase [Clostridia bacterium]HPK15977.1 inositol 2-dehydrogenase [Clostridia bacterium]